MSVRQQVSPPLRQDVAIVDREGRPLPDFLRRLNALLNNDEANAGEIGTKADESTVITAGAGLTGGGDLSADRTLAVGAGTGIIANADDVAIDLTAEAERIRDTIAAAVQDSSTINFADNDGADTMALNVIADSIGPTELAPTAVTPGTYGDATHAPRLVVDQEGRITGVSEVAISGGSGSWIPLVDGSEPPVFITDGAGVLILVAGP